MALFIIQNVQIDGLLAAPATRFWIIEVIPLFLLFH